MEKVAAGLQILMGGYGSVGGWVFFRQSLPRYLGSKFTIARPASSIRGADLIVLVTITLIELRGVSSPHELADDGAIPLI